MRNILKSLILLIILIASCQNKPGGFKITGEIEGILDSSLITLYDLKQQIYLDSAYTKDGKFVLQGEVENPTTCWLRNGEEYSIIQVENVEMTFKSTIKNMFLNSLIKGGKEQELQNELKKLQRPHELISYGALDSLKENIYTNDAERQTLIRRLSKSQSISHEIYINFGKNHRESYLGLDILYMNRKHISKDSLTNIYKNLSESYKNTHTAKAIKIYLYEKTVEIGKPFIDFDSRTIDGKPFKMSSLKGNNIYLTFWSAGCGPCRIENKFLSEHFEDIPENIKILSFSIDKNIDAWEKASKIDNIKWLNVSDYSGTEGRVKTLYGVQAIPTSFVIDRNGIVIKRLTGFDTDGKIIEKLKEIIAKNENVHKDIGK